MDRAEFDKFAEEYRSLHASNISISGESPEYFAEYKVQDLSNWIIKSGGASRRILDFGAGVGTSVSHFKHYFPESDLTCLDVSEKSLSIGAARFPGSAEFRCFDGKNVPFPDGYFDVAFAACVFHHIDAAEHPQLLRELRRTLSVNGTLCLFEHNPFNPLTRQAVSTCPFDENAVLIKASVLAARLRTAGFSRIERSYRIFFPRSLRYLRPLEAHLGWFALGAQYSLMARP